MKAYLVGKKIIHIFDGVYSNCGLLWIGHRNLRGEFRFSQIGKLCKRCK